MEKVQHEKCRNKSRLLNKRASRHLVKSHVTATAIKTSVSSDKIRNNIMGQFMPDLVASLTYVLHLDQWYSNLARKIHFPVKFSSNPDQTHLPVMF